MTRRQLRSRSGSALIEFALIAPILIALLLGLYDLAPAMMVRFKVASATQAVADLATQSATMQTSDVANYFGAGADVVAPFSPSNLKLRITNVASNGIGSIFVYWSCGQGALPPLIPGASYDNPTPNGVPVDNLLTRTSIKAINTSFVIVESQYVFTPPAGFVFGTAQTLTNAAYALPRVSTYIAPTTGVLGFIPIPPVGVLLNLQTTVSGGITCRTGNLI